MASGVIFDVKEMSVNDGPGIRTTIFFKGCPLRCRWCHNPEGLSLEPELKEAGTPCLHCDLCRRPCAHEDCRGAGRCLHICPQGRLSRVGECITADELAARLHPQASFLQTHGGITLSGGEPLAQPEFLLALMQALKPLHLAVETSGYAADDVFQAMHHLADLILIDLKHMNDTAHRSWTGVGNQQILAHICWLGRQDKPFIVRMPLIPGVNDSIKHLDEAAAFLAALPTLQRVELLPYNPLAGSKYAAVGRIYDPGFTESAQPNIACQSFISRGIDCQVQ